MLELRRWLPGLEPWDYEGVTIYGPVSGDELDEGIASLDGDEAGEYPIIQQLMLAARLAIDEWEGDEERAEARRALRRDPLAKEHPGLPTVRAIFDALDPPRHLFSPNFLADAPYDYYLLTLRDADLHCIFLDDTNSGSDMLGFIDGRASLDEAVTGAVGLLERWFREENTIGVPEEIRYGLLDRLRVEAILRASPYFEESRAQLTDGAWEETMRGSE
ncbi:MAG TPA: hypothetical protein VFL91_30145 [Thermomicrobiales bacterium]|nr:hypothetical protein [Thermomicrobiales bacterium]